MYSPNQDRFYPLEPETLKLWKNYNSDTKTEPKTDRGTSVTAGTASERVPLHLTATRGRSSFSRRCNGDSIAGENQEPKIAVFNKLNRGRVALFIDGNNLFYAALQLGIEINYKKLLHCLVAGSRLLRPFFYTGVDSNNDKQQSFLLWMRRNGYRVIAKELLEFSDGSKKADLDIEICVDMMTLIGCYDTAVLVSGDGNLAYAVNAISYRGVRVEIVSLRSMTSDSLINVADAYVDLQEIKNYIQKSPSAAICS
ncbi:MAG: NYN domain-containing protein [Xenococcaceae cyanobacterium MO_188.B32]|nr:NYN domain-containing protein [Xenococcaceae cyanobacterium MO_188.B32]